MTPIHSRRNFWLSSVGLGLAGCYVSTAAFGLIYRGYSLVPGLGSLITGVMVAALTLALLDRQQVWLDQRLPWEKGIGRRFGIQISLAAICALLPAALALSLHIVSNALTSSSSFLRLQDLAVLTAVSGTLVALAVLLNLGLFLMHQWRESSLTAERYRKENVEFRFEMLRNQVNPHFLFNSLNTLAGLVYQDPDTASSFTRELARVYRYVLEAGEKEIAPLEQELVFLDAFIYLVKIRYAEGLDVAVNVPQEARLSQMPPLTLQLLVENAIKHNVVSASRPLRIDVYSESDTLCVSNTLQPKLVPEAGTHTGLSNIRNRYAFFTDRPVEIINGPSQFIIRLPLLGS